MGKFSQINTTVAMDPSNPSNGQEVVFSGTGYTVGASARVFVTGPTANTNMYVAVDGNGEFQSDPFPITPGSYKVQVYEDGKKPLAELAFSVG